MKLSMPTEMLRIRFGDVKSIEIIAEAGFDAYDYSMFFMQNENDILNTDDYKSHIEKLKETAKKCGISCNQAHAPFPSSKDDETNNKIIFDKILRSIEIAGALGAKCIIVHPKQHLKYMYNKEALYEMNMDFYNSLIPYAKNAGVKIAIENMFGWDANREVICDSVCSHAEEFCRYADDLNSPWITVCLDIGHCAVVGDDPANMIFKLGNRIEALHVHDNRYKNDDHMIPYAGKLDWHSITSALAKVGYSGDFTFETDNFYNSMDDSFIPTATRFLHDTGRHLISLIGKGL